MCSGLSGGFQRFWVDMWTTYEACFTHSEEMRPAGEAPTGLFHGRMMFTLEANFDQFERGLTDFERRQVPFAMSLALNETRKDVLEADREHKRRVFDNPTRFTLNSTFATRASKRELSVEFQVKEFAAKGTPAAKYLKAQIVGGYRQQKRSERALTARGYMQSNEYWVPGPGVRINAYGNVSGATIVRILSDLQVAADPAQNRSAVSTKRNKNYRRERFFVPSRGSRLAPGVWVRRGKRILPALLFVSAPHYERRYKFFATGAETARHRLPIHWKAAFERAMATAR